MKYVSITKARQQLPDLVSRVETTMIMRNNEPVAALLSVYEYEALKAAQARERDPEQLARLVQAHLDLQAGRPRAVTDFSQGHIDDLLEMADRAATEAETDAKERQRLEVSVSDV